MKQHGNMVVSLLYRKKRCYFEQKQFFGQGPPEYYRNTTGILQVYYGNTTGILQEYYRATRVLFGKKCASYLYRTDIAAPKIYRPKGNIDLRPYVRQNYLSIA